MKDTIMSGIFIGAILIVVIIFLFAIVMCSVGMDTDQKCASNGWRYGIVTWNFERYCAKEINETEHTRPLEEILK